MSEGTVAVRENCALLGSAEELLAGEIYKLVSQLFKTKLDTVYRLIDTLKIVLTTRLTEAKLSGATTTTSDF
jgi:Fe2+ or Zn2+ uptake regulation protein